VTIFNRLNKKVAGALAAILATVAIGSAAVYAIQNSGDGSTTAELEPSESKNLRDLRQARELAEAETQPTVTVPTTTTTTLPPTITLAAGPTTVRAARAPAPPPVTAPPSAVPPNGALAKCDAPAELKGGTTTSFPCRIEVGSQFRGELMVSCSVDLGQEGNCRLDPMWFEAVPGGVYTFTATISLNGSAYPGQNYGEILANQNPVGPFTFRTIAGPDYVWPVTWTMVCSPRSFVAVVGTPLEATCAIHMERFQGSISLVKFTGEVSVPDDAPSSIDVPNGDAAFTVHFDTSNTPPGNYRMELFPLPGLGSGSGIRWGDASVINGVVEIQLVSPPA